MCIPSFHEIAIPILWVLYVPHMYCNKIFLFQYIGDHKILSVIQYNIVPHLKLKRFLKGRVRQIRGGKVYSWLVAMLAQNGTSMLHGRVPVYDGIFWSVIVSFLFIGAWALSEFCYVHVGKCG